ncbi:structural maintenance of chromosomes protein 5 isoform X1 [Neodiprion pinetum]|uniref:structural maintenance of chromosomes protein 5 isoform X1 n=1 Tax=Neodiprion pinetum TaxID=441929 RepID=UPI001EDEE689|nr:structural maintenance of chromosomes protein 5 isoform X1 [Neodiprion pinetum]
MANSNVERGIIVKICVENFVTYDHAIIKPGRNLNVIIGPNGTGKSTIVCAIVLGLGGKPKVIGRALHVGEYVKSGRQKGKIEIELKNPGKKNHTVTRTITSDGHTQWMLNGKHVSLKEVEQLTKSLNIQVDNLCQFLPQDKVQDFSKMNPQELLENTERSVGDPILLEYHTKLKEHRKRHIDLQEQLINKGNLLERQTQKYDRLKEIVGGIKERTAIKTKILNLKQKKAWLQYDQGRQQLMEAKQEWDAASKEQEKLREAMKPIDKDVTKITSRYSDAERAVNSQSKQLVTKARNLRNMVDQLLSYEEKIQERDKSLAAQIHAEVTRDQEIANAQQMKSKLENDLELITNEFGDEKSLVEKQQDILHRIENHRAFINKFASHVHRFKQEEDQIRSQIRVLEGELQSVKDVERQRLALLRQRSQDAYKAVVWLRENTDKFSRIIHEPMLIKINVKSAKYSKYFENIISNRDLCAFVCENKQDMNLLMQFLRDQEKLQINCVHSDPDKIINMNPNIPIENIAQYGFEYYLSSLVDAPQTILNYLVMNYRIHNIPVGNDSVENNAQDVPWAINCFYSRNKSYFVSQSKYTREKSTKMSTVAGNGSLSVILDTDKLNDIQQRLRLLVDRKTAVAQKVVAIEKKLEDAEKEMVELRAERGQCQHHIEQMKTVRSRIAMTTQRIDLLQAQRTSIEEIKETCKREIQAVVKAQVKVYKKYNEALEEYIETSKNGAHSKLEMKLLQRTLVAKTNEYREMKERCAAAERTVRKCEMELQPLRTEASRLREAAKVMTNGLEPQNKDFAKLNKAFSKLPNNIEDINDELKVSQAKVFCLGNNADGDNVLQEFEKVKVDVEELKQYIEAKTAEVHNINQEMENIRKKWIPPLQQLVEDIDKNFSSYLASLNCAGEVSITHGENIMDFEEYGLKIRVKFRDTDELQELTRTHQSGGERAVTTAIYMIALQELSTVPFRCVDEINQGMDAINERRIFELIVNITGKSNGSQYFLLTPKLLPALLYTETVTVHCVFNGPFVTSAKEFDMNEYCQELAYQNSEEQQ